MKDRSAKLARISSTSDQTLGMMTLYDQHGFPFFVVHTLELPWLDNKKGESCIPLGSYIVEKRNSSKYGDHFHIINVEGRSFILIHNANYVRQLRGCIAVGNSHTDIDGDGLRDVTASKKTMKQLLKLMPDKFELTIYEQAA